MKQDYNHLYRYKLKVIVVLIVYISFFVSDAKGNPTFATSYEAVKQTTHDAPVYISLIWDNELFLTVGGANERTISVNRVNTDQTVSIIQNINLHTSKILGLSKISDTEFVSVSWQNPQFVIYRISAGSFGDIQTGNNVFDITTNLITSVTALATDSFVISSHGLNPIRIFKRNSPIDPFTQVQTLSDHDTRVNYVEKLSSTTFGSAGEGINKIAIWKYDTQTTSYIIDQYLNGFSDEATKITRVTDLAFVAFGGFNEPNVVIYRKSGSNYSAHISATGLGHFPTAAAIITSHAFVFTYNTTFRVYTLDDSGNYSLLYQAEVLGGQKISNIFIVSKNLMISEDQSCVGSTHTTNIYNIICPATLGLVPNDSGTCVPCEIPSDFIYNKKCYKKCPTGTGTKTLPKVCETCELPSIIFDSACRNNFVCDNTKYKLDGNNCIHCLLNEGNDKIYHQGNCIVSCPDPLIKDATENICVTKPVIPLKPEPTPTPSTTPTSTTTNEPSTTTSQQEVVQEVNCSPGRTKKIENEKTICVSCLEAGEYLEAGKCVTQCSSATKNIDEVRKECLLCTNLVSINKDDGSFTCVDSCNNSQGYFLFELMPNSCVHCKTINKVISKNKCELKCEQGFGADDNKICMPCSSFPNKNFLLDGNCVEACPSSYKAQDYLGTKNVCRFITIDPTCTEPELYCKNESTCSIQPSGDLKCSCKESFYGARCGLTNVELSQLTNQVNDILNNINSIDLNDTSSIAKITQLSELLQSAPQIATIDLSNQLINVASDALRRSISNPASITDPDKLYELIDTAYLSKTLTNNTENKMIIEEIKAGVELMTDLKLKSISNLTSFLNGKIDEGGSRSFIFSGDSFKIQIQDGSKEFNEEARKNKLPIVDFSACEEKLKELSIIPSNEKVYAINTILDSSLLFEQDYDILSTSKGISTKLVNSKSEVLDTSKCDSFIIKMPINNNLIDASGQEEVLFQNGIDVFNSTNEAFSDKCTSFPSKNGTDLTLNSRRTKFDKTALCSEGTKYIGVDEHQYAICESEKLPKESVSKFEEAVFDALKNDNYLLFLCYSNAIKNVIKNIAFWGFSSVSLVFSAAAVLHIMIFSVKSNLASIHNHDAITFLKNGENAFSSNQPISSGIPFLPYDKLKNKSKDNYDALSFNSNISSSKFIIKPRIIGNDKFNEEKRNMNVNSLPIENMEISNNENMGDNSPNENEINKRSNMYSTNNFIAGNDNLNLKENKPEVKHYSTYKNIAGNDVITNNNSMYHNNRNSNSNQDGSIHVLGLNLGNDDSTHNESNTVVNVVNNSNNINNVNENNEIKNKSDETLKDPVFHEEKVIFKTKADIESLPFAYRIRYDERGFCQYLWDDFKHRQEFLNLILIVSIKKPFLIRIFRTMFLISLEFAFNSYFYQDNNVEKQAEYIEKNGPGSVGIGYIIINELMQSFVCVAASVIISFLLDLIIIIPASTEEILNQKLNNEDENIREEGINEFKGKMRWRYIIWIVATFIIHCICWYFAICFCSVFVNSNKAWLYKGLLSLAIGFIGIKVFVSLFLSTFRSIVKCYPFLCFIKAFSILSCVLDIL